MVTYQRLNFKPIRGSRSSFLIYFFLICLIISGLIYFFDPKVIINNPSASTFQTVTTHHRETPFTRAKAQLLIEDQRKETTRSCSRLFGIDLVLNWRKAQMTICSGHRDSLVSCRVNNDYQDISRIFCMASNVGINVPSPTQVKDAVPKTKYQIPLEISFINSNDSRDDVLTVDCNPMIYKWLPTKIWAVPQQLFLEHMKVVPTLQCTNMVNHTVFWIHRYDATNPFHFFEDLITIFQILLVQDDQDPQDIELVLQDSLAPNNSLVDLYATIFGKGVRLIQKDPFPEGTCFKNSIFGIWGDASHLSHAGGAAKNTPCLSSPTFRALRYFLYLSAGLDPGPGGSPQPSSPPIDLPPPFSSNKIDPSPQGPDSDHHHPAQYQIAFISRKQYIPTREIGRVLENEDQLLDYIRTHLPPNWNLNVYRPELMTTFREQITSFHKLTILIGIHGAGVANTLFMSEGTHLIEIFAGDRNELNRHYYNFCKWLGLHYYSPGYYYNSVPPEPIWEIIAEIISEVEGRGKDGGGGGGGGGGGNDDTSTSDPRSSLDTIN